MVCMQRCGGNIKSPLHGIWERRLRLMRTRCVALSDKGAADLKKGGADSALSSLSLFVPMALCLMLLQEICKPLLGEKADTPNIWLYTILAVASVVVIFVAN